MTLLDTHIWFWWCEGNPRLGNKLSWLDAQPSGELGISAFSIWEICKLDALGKISLPVLARHWILQNLAGTGIQVFSIDREIAICANELPPGFHRDPADQIIVATARFLDCELITADAKILAYPHVKTIAL